jgi:hypothetical protein
MRIGRLRTGYCWLGAVMLSIERMFILMAVIGLVGFVGTILYLTR